MPILKQVLNLAEPVDTSRQDKFGRWRESCIWQALSEYQWKLHADMNLQCCSTLKSDYMKTIPFLKYTPCLISGVTSHLVRNLWFFLFFCMWEQNMLPRVADEHTRINITRQTINCRNSLKLLEGVFWMQLCKNMAQGRRAKKDYYIFCESKSQEVLHFQISGWFCNIAKSLSVIKVHFIWMMKRTHGSQQGCVNFQSTTVYSGSYTLI